MTLMVHICDARIILNKHKLYVYTLSQCRNTVESCAFYKLLKSVIFILIISGENWEPKPQSAEETKASINGTTKEENLCAGPKSIEIMCTCFFFNYYYYFFTYKLLFT